MKMYWKRWMLISVCVGLIAAIVAPSIAKIHVYKIKSGFSGDTFTISFAREPAEDEFLDAVIYREPLIEDRYELTRDWRKSRDGKSILWIKMEADTALAVAPYDPSLTHTLKFSDDEGKVRGIWVTQPSTRSKYPIVLIVAAYGVCAFGVAYIASFTAIVVVNWLWYFLLRRVAELSSAVRGQ